MTVHPRWGSAVPETAPVLSPELVEELRKLKDGLGPLPLWTLKERHALGSALLGASKREGPGHGGLYGTRLMGQLAEALGMDAGVLNKHKQFAASFDQQELAHLAGVRTPKGEPLAWSHVRLLMEVGKRAKRRDLIERAAARGWTSARLGAAIRDLKGEKTRGGGPKPIRPGGLQDLVLQMTQFLSEWENRHEQVWSRADCSLARLAEAMPRRRASEKDIKGLEALSKAWGRAVARSEEMVKAVETATARMRGRGKGVQEEQAGT